MIYRNVDPDRPSDILFNDAGVRGIPSYQTTCRWAGVNTSIIYGTNNQWDDPPLAWTVAFGARRPHTVPSDPSGVDSVPTGLTLRTTDNMTAAFDSAGVSAGFPGQTITGLPGASRQFATTVVRIRPKITRL